MSTVAFLVVLAAVSIGVVVGSTRWVLALRARPAGREWREKEELQGRGDDPDEEGATLLGIYTSEHHDPRVTFHVFYEPERREIIADRHVPEIDAPTLTGQKLVVQDPNDRYEVLARNVEPGRLNELPFLALQRDPNGFEALLQMLRQNS